MHRNWSFFLTTLLYYVNCHDIKGFDDKILFKINWPGDTTNEVILGRRYSLKVSQPFRVSLRHKYASKCSDKRRDLPGVEQLIVTTANKEKYKCFLPNIQENKSDTADVYDGPNPLELLKPLFTQEMCSYRLESYWTYDVCHGRYVRQYHEDREGKKIKLQEYYLGKWEKQKQLQVLENVNRDKEKTKVIPTKKIDGIQLPYYEIVMDDGTLCDLNSKPRSTKVLYVCYPHGKHEIYSLKETSTCEYEVIVLSPLLCAHPQYKPQESGENAINCHPMEGGSKKPRGLLAMEAESLKLRHQNKLVDDKLKKVYAVFKVDKDGQDGETRVRVEIHPVDVFGEEEPTTERGMLPLESAIDSSPVENFLAGRNCLNGGSGWWKYEFCYGRYVEQYHVEKDGSRTALNLGRFNKAAHLEWIEKNPHKRPKPLSQRRQLSHFYSDGSICDKTGKPRQTEVKLKCLENSSSTGQVSLYLLEPRYCDYILGVESPLICDILARADENGLVKMASELTQDTNDLDDATIEDEDTSSTIKVSVKDVDNVNLND